jgi:hypothetical protein
MDTTSDDDSAGSVIAAEVRARREQLVIGAVFPSFAAIGIGIDWRRGLSVDDLESSVAFAEARGDLKWWRGSGRRRRGMGERAWLATTGVVQGLVALLEEKGQGSLVRL